MPFVLIATMVPVPEPMDVQVLTPHPAGDEKGTL